jgi:hypothetical protein
VSGADLHDEYGFDEVTVAAAPGSLLHEAGAAALTADAKTRPGEEAGPPGIHEMATVSRPLPLSTEAQARLEASLDRAEALGSDRLPAAHPSAPPARPPPAAGEDFDQPHRAASDTIVDSQEFGSSLEVGARDTEPSLSDTLDRAAPAPRAVPWARQLNAIGAGSLRTTPDESQRRDGVQVLVNVEVQGESRARPEVRAPVEQAVGPKAPLESAPIQPPSAPQQRAGALAPPSVPEQQQATVEGADDLDECELAAQKFSQPELGTGDEPEPPSDSAETEEPVLELHAIDEQPAPPPSPRVEPRIQWDEIPAQPRSRGSGGALLLSGLLLLGALAAATVILPPELVAKYAPISLPWVRPPAPTATLPVPETTPAAQRDDAMSIHDREPPTDARRAGDDSSGAGDRAPGAGTKRAGGAPLAHGGRRPPLFNRAAARSAMAAATGTATRCRKEEDGGPPLTGQVEVTFAPTGEVSAVRVTGEVAGSGAADCIKRAYQQARVPGFRGDPVTLGRILVVR